jgi:hypothetical protein
MDPVKYIAASFRLDDRHPKGRRASKSSALLRSLTRYCDYDSVFIPPAAENRTIEQRCARKEKNPCPPPPRVVAHEAARRLAEARREAGSPAASTSTRKI